MFTFEQVLEIFKDYLAQDNEVEVIRTKRGYLRITRARIFHFVMKGSFARHRKSYLMFCWRTARTIMR